jgi:hypothetical protein
MVHTSAAPGAPSSSGAASASPSGARTDPSSLADWRATVGALYAARARGFETGSAEALDRAYTADSPLRAADAAEIGELRGSGAAVEGFAPEVVEVRSARVTGHRAELRLVDRWPGYTVVQDGDATQDVPPRGDRLVAMVLVRGAHGWRIDTARLLP